MGEQVQQARKLLAVLYLKERVKAKGSKRVI